MKLQTKITAWVYMALFACVVILTLSALVHMYFVPPNMGFGGLICLFLCSVSTPFLIGWIGLVFQKRWAWWILLVLNTFLSTLMLYNVTMNCSDGIWYTESTAVMLLFLLAVIILLMDCPNRWQSITTRVD
jgi:hypothetical protein